MTVGVTTQAAEREGREPTRGQRKEARETFPIDGPDEQAPYDFVAVAEKLAEVDDLFSGGSGEPVTFDSARAIDRGVAPTIVSLAEELAAFTNDLVGPARESTDNTSPEHWLREDTSLERMDVTVSPETYPAVSRFYRAATAYQLRDADTAGGRVQAHGTGSCLLLTPAQCTCGFFTNPRPNATKARSTHKASDPAAVLKSWGYHKSPEWRFGGGWTRPRTYTAWLCGFGTFRDHAWVGSDGKTFYEQNYEGWTPRGEPNPEIYRSGPWPYAIWPAYVWWWHDNINNTR